MDLNWHILTERQFQRKGLPRWCSGKESACHCRRHKRHGFNPWVRKTPWSRKWWPTPVSLPRKFHGQRSLVGYSPRGLKELNTTEWPNWTEASLSMEFSRQEYWNGLPFPTPADLSDPGIKPTSLASPALTGGFFPTVPPGKPLGLMSPSSGVGV